MLSGFSYSAEVTRARRMVSQMAVIRELEIICTVCSLIPDKSALLSSLLQYHWTLNDWRYRVNSFMNAGSTPWYQLVQTQKGDLMKSSVTNLVKGIGIIAIGVAICLALIWLGEYDDAPGASLVGMLLMIGSVVLGVKIARRKTTD